MKLRINASYLDQPVGTGTYTRNLVHALPEFPTIAFPEYLLQARPSPYWTRRALEIAVSLVPGSVLSPYWPASTGARAIISALDLVQFREATSLERRILGHSIRSARAVLVLSSMVATEVESELGRQCVVAPPFPDRSWYAERTMPKVARNGRVRIGYWGGWHPRKGMTKFLTALSRTRIAREVEIVSIGGEFAEGVRVERHAPRSISQLVDLVDTCTLSVYPSREEGFGLPVFESLLRSCPVITRRLAVYDEFASSSTSRIVLESDEPDDIVRAIEQAMSAPELPPHATLLWASHAESVARLRDSLVLQGIV